MNPKNYKNDINKMAKGVEVTTKFAGSAATEIWLDIMQESDAIKNDLFTSIADIKTNDYTIMKTKTDAGFQDYSCKFDTQNGVILSEVTKKLKEIEVTNEFCKDQLTKRWSALSLSSAVPASVTETFSEVTAILEDLKLRISNTFGQNLFMGVQSQNGQFDGVLTQLEPFAVMPLSTPTEVRDALRLAVKSVPKAVRTRKDFTILVSEDIAMLYAEDFENRGFSQTNDAVGKYKIVTCNDAPEGTILAYNKANINILADIVSDEPTIKIIDLEQTTGDEMFRLKAKFRVTTLIVEPNDVVFITGRTEPEHN